MQTYPYRDLLYSTRSKCATKPGRGSTRTVITINETREVEVSAMRCWPSGLPQTDWLCRAVLQRADEA